ncbi:methionine aminotransferase [Acinetobacter rathckeae]|uniref:methionine aminotransferase n=1 Tax=Acinetobacter rathckeae TaxID=2605272 RepID=UPI0018A2BB26|nr:methionine aminotransferase [Acinetobacter rathckeae]MBF7688216.1 aminotransferase class I/II-fold pyridoxal phosphate-dependent enzyme [Acinetobacter rathckeae]
MFHINNKVPQTGTTIFSTMSALAQQLNALNLSQGFPNFAPPPSLIQALQDATAQGYNQYPLGDGLPALREQVCQIFKQRNPQLNLDPNQEVTITSGATIALHCAIQAFIQAGDEVIVFDPSYDSYAPSIALVGAKAIHVHLQAPHFSVDWQKVKDAISPKTRMIIVNTPHNPTGAIWSKQDWFNLIEIIEKHNIMVLSDEVYEHLVFDQKQHYSALDFPKLRDRSMVVGSFGKSFHVTGWKTGYCTASPKIMQAFRQVYQFASFCGVAPVQVALSQFMQQHPEHLAQLASFYQAKRDLFLQGLKESRFTYTTSQGTYFQTLDYSQIQPHLNDVEMCQYLAEQHKIVAIPLSAFYKKPPQQLRLLRFCFAKQNSTLQHATEILATC